MMEELDISHLLEEKVRERAAELDLSEKATKILVWIAGEALVRSPKIDDDDLHAQLLRLGRELEGS